LLLLLLDLPSYIGDHPRQTKYPESSILKWNAHIVTNEICKHVGNFINGVTTQTPINDVNEYEYINTEGFY
jgi:hypothetical protein